MAKLLRNILDGVDCILFNKKTKIHGESDSPFDAYKIIHIVFEKMSFIVIRSYLFWTKDIFVGAKLHNDAEV